MLKGQENGRSMIEMLGVLSVIGVLSVGGVWGYTAAMKRHYANEMLYQLNIRANQAAMQIMSGREPSVADLEDGFSGCEDCQFSVNKSSPYATSNQFVVQITGHISKDLCHHAFLQLGDNSSIRAVHMLGGSQDSADCDNLGGGTTSLFFTYSDDLSAEGANAFTPGGGGGGSSNACTNIGEKRCNSPVIQECKKGTGIMGNYWGQVEVCDYGCETTSCRVSTCSNGDTVCWDSTYKMTCQDGEWKRPATKCNWGCNNGGCNESCSTNGAVKDYGTISGVGSKVYCAKVKCQSNTWTFTAFCDWTDQGGLLCNDINCPGVENDALAEFEATYPIRLQIP